MEDIVLGPNRYRNQVQFSNFLKRTCKPIVKLKEEISACIGLALTYNLYTFIKILIS